MLRTLAPSEPELLRLCRTKQWISVSVRSRSHPIEAVPSESAVRGEGVTALAIAVRCRAPVDVIQALLEADIHQLGIFNQQRGSIIHEALKQQVADDVLDYIIRSVIQYEAAVRSQISSSHSTNEHRFDRSLFSLKDELGRTALHYMVERTRRALELGEVSVSNWNIFRTLLLAHPESIQVMDSDGSTPLILLLLLRCASEEAFKVEAEVFRMVHLIVSNCPKVATISRKLPPPWHSLGDRKNNNFNEDSNDFATQNDGILGDGAPTPLYYAILYGRAMPTIDAILDASNKVGMDGCATIVTAYHEVPLHVALATRAPIPLLSKLLLCSPNASIVSDVYGLSPLDWMWIRHVSDWYQVSPRSRLVSRGRFLSPHFLEWHKNVSRWLTAPLTSITTSGANSAWVHNVQSVERGKEDLLQGMRVLLPIMAAAGMATSSFEPPHRHHHHEQVGEIWPLLHAACFVPCPLAMVHLALESSEYHVLRTRDLRSGRLPLHYAADRLGCYTANFPVGFSREIHHLTEPSVVPLLVSHHAEGCRVMDGHGQLPLHVAIDAAKRCRATTTTTMMITSAKKH